jgi:hypothetical protein
MRQKTKELRQNEREPNDMLAVHDSKCRFLRPIHKGIRAPSPSIKKFLLSICFALWLHHGRISIAVGYHFHRCYTLRFCCMVTLSAKKSLFDPPGAPKSLFSGWLFFASKNHTFSLQLTLKFLSVRKCKDCTITKDKQEILQTLKVS